VEEIDISKSLKLQNYLEQQELNEEERTYLDIVDLSNLMLKSEFEAIKSQVERYHTLKSQVEKGEGDIILASDEMKYLANSVLGETGRDINTIDLSQLNTVTMIEKMLQNSGIKSNNDLIVRFSDDDYFNRNDYVRMSISGKENWGRYGIKSGARIAITRSGKILTARNAIYEK